MHAPATAPEGMEQKQKTLLQGTLTLHVAPQIALVAAWFRNCRAETVPAQRTPITSAVKNIELIFFMIAFLPVPGPNEQRLFCRLGCDEIAHARRKSGLNDASAAQNVGAMVFLAVAETAAGGGLNIQGQLPGGNCSCKENGGDHRCQLP